MVSAQEGGPALTAVAQPGAPAKPRVPLFRYGAILTDHTGTFIAVLLAALAGIATPSIVTGAVRSRMG